jgi:hypothetical protein
MTKNEIIATTLQAMGLPRAPEQEEPFNDEPDDEELIIAELQLILPATDIKTCGDFKHLNVTCCEICHPFYPIYDMSVIELPGGDQAWVCCSVRSALTHSSPRGGE